MKVKAVVLTPALIGFYRFKLEQRELTFADVAMEMGYSSSRSVTNALTCNTSRRRNRRGRPNAVSVEWMDRFDSAITRLTDARGGVYRCSGTQPKGALELARQLHSSAA